jgi:hypothetical protein
VDNIVKLCGTCHDGVHTALNACVAFNGPPPPLVWLRFHKYYRATALEAIRRAGGVIKVYTHAEGT